MHQHFMSMALREAEQAFREDEVPVGAVIVHEGRVVASAHNQREQLHDPTAHAEMIAITQAAESLRSWRLDGCTMYVTLEPCPMCAGAILLARLPWLVYGASRSKSRCSGLFVSPLERLAVEPSGSSRSKCAGRSMRRDPQPILSGEKAVGKKVELW
jgi:tRNA(Arg) A34 adenosine deaminase TadA